MASARSSSRNAAAGGALASCTPPSAAIVTSAAAVRDAVLNVLKRTLPTSCPSGAGAPVKTPRLDAFPHASSAWLRARAETTKLPTKKMMVRMRTSRPIVHVSPSDAAPPSLPVAVTPTEPVRSAPALRWRCGVCSPVTLRQKTTLRFGRIPQFAPGGDMGNFPHDLVGRVR